MEGCGELYCPWETFKRIALENVDFDCIQQPLKGSTETLYEESTAQPVDGGDDDDDTLDVWAIIGLTTAACTVVFLILQVVVFQYQKKKQSEQSEDLKQGLVYN